LLSPEFVAGRWFLPVEKEAIVVSETIDNFYPNLQPGDQWTIKLVGQKESWKIVWAAVHRKNEFIILLRKSKLWLDLNADHHKDRNFILFTCRG
jgi:hypothetical protein